LMAAGSSLLLTLQKEEPGSRDEQALRTTDSTPSTSFGISEQGLDMVDEVRNSVDFSVNDFADGKDSCTEGLVYWPPEFYPFDADGKSVSDEGLMCWPGEYYPFEPSQHTNFVMSPPLPQSSLMWDPTHGSKSHFEAFCKPSASADKALNDSATLHTNFVVSPPFPQSSMIGNWSYPSPGSKGHFEGLCKPCAFLYEGCLNDSACDFCHLCPPGELKRRKRDKLAARRKLNRQQRESGRRNVGSKIE